MRKRRIRHLPIAVRERESGARQGMPMDAQEKVPDLTKVPPCLQIDKIWKVGSATEIVRCELP